MLQILITISGLFNYGTFIAFTEVLVVIGVNGSVGSVNDDQENLMSTGLRTLSLIFSVINLIVSLLCASFLE